ncbi:MAG TPA: TolC family protein [Puia sp.]|nr:TolC family protein [Puia sp.]
MKKFLSHIIAVMFFYQIPAAQTLRLPDILDTIARAHPSIKMYEAEIRSLDAAASGAQNWMPPEISSGFWMTPYNPNLWMKDGNANTGMGQYMISVSQMFPNRKLNDANEKYMRAISSVELENKESNLNELFALAKSSYNSLIVIQKKLALIDDDDRLLQLMVTNAETRYKNGLGKVSAYYKAKAAQGNLEKKRIILQNEAVQKRITLNTLMNRDRLFNFSIDTNYKMADYADRTFDNTVFYSSRNDLKGLDKSIQLTYLRQEVEKESLRPQFGAQFSHMFGFGGFPEEFTLMATVRIPFANWSSRERKANIESLQWKAAALENQKQTMANQYAGVAYGIQEDIKAIKRQLEILKKDIIPALVRNYQSTLLAYEQNTEELFSLYDAWETLNSTQFEYLDQLQQLFDKKVDLEKLLETK